MKGVGNQVCLRSAQVVDWAIRLAWGIVNFLMTSSNPTEEPQATLFTKMLGSSTLACTLRLLLSDHFTYSKHWLQENAFSNISHSMTSLKPIVMLSLKLYSTMRSAYIVIWSGGTPSREALTNSLDESNDWELMYRVKDVSMGVACDSRKEGKSKTSFLKMRMRVLRC